MKTRHRKQRGVLNIAELPPQYVQRSKHLRRAEILRAHLKLKQLVDQEEYEDARLLFTELIRTSRYNIQNFWKIGIQIIGRTSPNQLTDYLRAVYINAPPYLSLVTFSAYIDQLMIDKSWSKAIEEIDLRSVHIKTGSKRSRTCLMKMKYKTNMIQLLCDMSDV
ncbi:hypothetical protein BD560DRAFT_116598 [Blakeslea trispora]|nr:hypothetical protein BD560DRAFT_116598 [Blakeslea trispora]